MIRAKAVVELAETLASELTAQGAGALLVEVEQPLLRTLATMERLSLIHI